MLKQFRGKSLVGQSFGELTVLSYVKPGPYWLCRCTCGIEKEIAGSNLLAGRNRSCGCKHGESISKANRTHWHTRGGRPTAEYSIWKTMRRRCDNVKSISYPNYGGRGIKVCDRWASFENFLADMGKRPGPEYSIERRESDKDYEPDNCYWATRDVQANNRRNNTRLTLNDETMTLLQWSRRTGIKYQTIAARLKIGWSVERALTTPLQKHR